MNSDEKPDSVRLTKMNRRVLIRRGLIAALILVCMASAYSFFLVFQFHRHIATFQKYNAGLLVSYEDDQGNTSVGIYGSAPGPFFIPAPFNRYHRSLYSIYLRDQPNTNTEEMDELFRLFHYFHKLEELHLEGILLDQDRANSISSLSNLKRLKLQRCQIEETCLISLLKTKELTGLSLEDSTFPEVELEQLKQMPNNESLQALNLANCHITDRTATILSQCRNLEFLDLSGTQITDLGLKQLARLPQLRILILDHTDVTDAGVAYLSSTPNLVELSLSNTGVSDESLETLKRDIPALRVSDD
ncbi:leucine-rich repeat domain-containing protein [Gimesia aquarii]|uniref:Leucine Rich repeats (2 copies) n=1 Tax=Gimesia aquarii TaxID=2527964 RepID=A0A517WP57_9PLAN|nr:leucine-rich repeat domain-containing protein [Gimesia aquarii]QDU07042.1 Leucine Rich repeats (2 copies) [Gimesia aquarii]